MKKPTESRKKSAKKITSEFAEYPARARELGATRAAIIDPQTVVTGEWVRLKCQFGCGGYGQCLTCPPYSPAPSQTAALLREYRSALLIQFDEIRPAESDRAWRKLKKMAVEFEREIFLANHPKAFAMTAGPCHYCRTCALAKGCVHPDLARPSMEGCGIDVYATAHNNKFPLRVVTSETTDCSYISLVLIE